MHKYGPKRIHVYSTNTHSAEKCGLLKKSFKRAHNSIQEQFIQLWLNNFFHSFQGKIWKSPQMLRKNIRQNICR